MRILYLFLLLVMPSKALAITIHGWHGDISTNAGNADEQTLRTVLASDQPALSVSGSSVVIQGSGGGNITSELVASSEALHVINIGMPNIANKFWVYVSSDDMDTVSPLVLTGTGNEVSLQALGGTCTFDINSGIDFIVDRNTAESFDFDFTLINPSVALISKAAASTCKVRITGAN